nr:vacuolar protein sorting associated protein 33A [Hymenolepis microstoma]
MSNVTSFLTTAPIKDVYQKELLKILDSYKGPKAIYWERRAITPVNLVIGSVLLKEHEVNHSFVLESANSAPTPLDVNSVFFIFYPELRTVDLIVKFLSSEFSHRRTTDESVKKDYCLIAIPKMSVACKSFLQGTKLLDKLAGVYDLPLTLLPIDNDLLSMEEPDCFADYSLRDKESGLFNFAKGLMKFQSVYGLFPRIKAKGSKAKRVVEMLTHMRQEANADIQTEDDNGVMIQPLNTPGQTDLLIIIDRSVDVLTPCLSQLIYEGLINEFWPVMYGSMKMPQSVNGSVSKRVHLNSADLLFSEIRDQNFANVGAVISKRTKGLSSVLNETKNSKSLTTLKQVVQQLPELRQMHSSASLHLSIAEAVQEYATTDNFISSYRAQQDFLNGNESDKIHPFIEQRILQMAPLEEILQLICIQSFCSGGLKQQAFELYMHEIIQMYGPEHMLTLNNLRILGLIEERSRLSMIARPGNNQTDPILSGDSSAAVRHTIASVSLAYESTLRRSLRLQLNRGDQTGEPNLDNDLAQIFGGSVPVSVRLVQAMALGWPTRPLISTSSIVNSHSTSILSTAASTAINASRRFVSHSSGTNGGDGSFVMNLIPAVEVNEVHNQGDSTGDTSNTSNSLIKNLTSSSNGERSRTVVIAFVGGMTHSELAALRKVAIYDEANFMFATTGMITWKTLIRSLSDPIPVAPTDDQSQSV